MAGLIPFRLSRNEFSDLHRHGRDFVVQVRLEIQRSSEPVFWQRFDIETAEREKNAQLIRPQPEKVADVEAKKQKFGDHALTRDETACLAKKENLLLDLAMASIVDQNCDEPHRRLFHAAFDVIALKANMRGTSAPFKWSGEPLVEFRLLVAPPDEVHPQFGLYLQVGVLEKALGQLPEQWTMGLNCTIRGLPARRELYGHDPIKLSWRAQDTKESLSSGVSSSFGKDVLELENGYVLNLDANVPKQRLILAVELETVRASVGAVQSSASRP